MHKADAMWPLLKELGAPEGCVEFKLIASVDRAIIAEATFYPSLDPAKGGKLAKETKRYRLVEVDPDDALR